VLKMPAIVGVAQVITLGSSSVFHIGDVYKIMPFSNAKTFSGAGSFNTGDSLQLHNNVSSTNTQDSDVYDQGIALNA
jgi:spore germination protein PA